MLDDGEDVERCTVTGRRTLHGTQDAAQDSGRCRKWWILDMTLDRRLDETLDGTLYVAEDAAQYARRCTGRCGGRLRAGSNARKKAAQWEEH